MANETVIVPILEEADIVKARQKGREIASDLGFSVTDQTLLATAISEVSRNIIEHAGSGEVALCRTANHQRIGIVVVARDRGPGIRDLALAMRDGYSGAGSLGLGLPGAKRLVDEFKLESTLGTGTTITMSKWLR